MDKPKRAKTEWTKQKWTKTNERACSGRGVHLPFFCDAPHFEEVYISSPKNGFKKNQNCTLKKLDVQISRPIYVAGLHRKLLWKTTDVGRAVSLQLATIRNNIYRSRFQLPTYRFSIVFFRKDRWIRDTFSLHFWAGEGWFGSSLRSPGSSWQAGWPSAGVASRLTD